MPTYEVPTISDPEGPTSSESSFRSMTEQPIQTAGPEATHPRESRSTMSQDNNNDGTYHRPRQILPDPEVFKGDIASYQNFKHLLKAKLYVDRQALGGPYERLWYAYGRLSGNAASHILPWMIANADSPAAVNDSTVTRLFEHLDFNYMDKELQRKAMYNLSALKQGSRTINELLATFDRYLMEAGQQNQPDNVKIFWLENTLNDDIFNRLVNAPTCNTFSEYCVQLQGVYDRHQKYQQRTAEHRRPSNRRATTAMFPPSAVPTPVAPAQDDPMDWEPSASRARNPQRKRARWVSSEEIRRRKQDGCCFRCGSAGHQIGQCPFLPAQRPTTRVAELNAEDVTDAVLEDSGVAPTALAPQGKV